MRKFLVLWLLACVSLAFADDSKISPDLKAKLSTQNPTVVVQYNQPPSLLDLQTIVNLAGSILTDLPVVNGVVAQLPLAQILNLSNQANVKYISLNRVQRSNLSNAAPAVNAFAAWQSGYTGAGIGVALIDSGVAAHPDPDRRIPGRLARCVESKLCPREFERGRSVRARHAHRRSDRG